MDGALHVVRHEADQKSEQHDDDHSDGFDAVVPLVPGNVFAGQKGVDDDSVTYEDDHKGEAEAHHQRYIIQRDEFLHPMTLWWLEAFGFIGDRVKLLARHEEG